MDLTREILLEVKDSNPFSPEADDFHPGKIAGQWKIEVVSYHLILLVEEGFLARHQLHQGTQNGKGRAAKDAGLRLTWKGHDLLEELIDESTFLKNHDLDSR